MRILQTVGRYLAAGRSADEAADDLIRQATTPGSGNEAVSHGAPDFALDLSTIADLRRKVHRFARFAVQLECWPTSLASARGYLRSALHYWLNEGASDGFIVAWFLSDPAAEFRLVAELQRWRDLPTGGFKDLLHDELAAVRGYRDEKGLKFRREGTYSLWSWHNWRHVTDFRYYVSALRGVSMLGELHERQITVSTRGIAHNAGIGTIAASADGSPMSEWRSAQRLVERGALWRSAKSPSEVKQANEKARAGHWQQIDPSKARTELIVHSPYDWLPDRLGSLARGSLAHQLTIPDRPTTPRGETTDASIPSPCVVAVEASLVSIPSFDELLHPVWQYVGLGLPAEAIWYLSEAQQRAMTVSELSRVLEMSKPTVRKALAALAEHEMVSRDGSAWVWRRRDLDAVAAELEDSRTGRSIAERSQQRDEAYEARLEDRRIGRPSLRALNPVERLALETFESE